ncbi:IS3 transposase [Serratia marcescens VGH107]|nr:IS3 transposase [Serratia marcescens VGH107]
MKYVFIEKYRAEFSIKAMCRVLRVARSGWYVWLRHRHQMNYLMSNSTSTIVQCLTTRFLAMEFHTATHQQWYHVVRYQ